MLQRYNERLEKARLELAKACRRNLSLLVRANYYGSIGLGSDGIEDGDPFYFLKDGKLLRQRLATRYERFPEEEIKPRDVPFERYSIGDLKRITEKIEEALPPHNIRLPITEDLRPKVKDLQI